MVSGERRHAEALREEAAAALAPRGLRLAEEKTRVVHIDEGFDFLAFTIRRMRKRGTQKQYVYTVPSRKAIQAIKDKVSAKTYRSTRHQSPEALIQSINRALAGSPGANYFRHGVSKAVFSKIDSHARGRIMRWLGTSTNKDAPASGCQNSGGASASPAPGRSQSTGSGSPARPSCRSPATATAAATSVDTPAGPSIQLAQRARHAESPVR